MNNVLAITISYVLGSFLTGYYLIKIRTGQDIRTMGSGSAGARNVGRILGRQGFVLTFLGDTLKGVLAVAISFSLKVDTTMLMASVLATVAGHIWPFQLNFKGGKGVSPALGAVLVFDYRIALGYFLVAIVIFVVSRKLELSGLAALVTLPITAYALNYAPAIIFGMSLLACLLLFAHRENIGRVISKG